MSITWLFWPWKDLWLLPMLCSIGAIITNFRNLNIFTWIYIVSVLYSNLLHVHINELELLFEWYLNIE